MKTTDNLLGMLPGLFPLAFMLFSCGENNERQWASGVFESTEIIVSSEVGGKIMALSASEGDKITEGAVIGVIDSTGLHLVKAQLQAQKAAVLAGRPDVALQIETTRQEIAKLEREQQRTEHLLAGDVATRKQLDDINAQLEVLRARLRSQESTLNTQIRALEAQANAIEAQIRKTEDQIARCRITSPSAGTVLVRYAQPGEVTGAGKPLIKMADLDRMILRAYITGDMLAVLTVGQEVQVLAEMGPQETRSYHGVITWIAGDAEFTPKTIQTQDERANLVYAVKVAVTNDDLLKIGMYGRFKTEKP